MGIFKKVALWWVGFISLGVMCLVFLPNDGPSAGILLADAMMLLTGLMCFAIFLKEPSTSNKPIFLNFSAYFFLSIAAFAYSFIGFEGSAVFPNSAFLRFCIYEFYTITMFFVLSFAVVYVVIDSLFNDFRMSRKYLITIILVGGTFAYYYYPFFENPKYLASTENYVDFKAVRTSVAELSAQGMKNPSIEEIAAITNLGFWRNGKQIGTLYDDQKKLRVTELLPYLNGENNLVLLYGPMYLNNIYMNVLCVVFIFLFFGYQYKNDPPQGAYIEKIIFLFLPYCSLEILHHYAYIKSVEYSTFEDVQQLGIYLTLVNMALLLVFFSLRLRFITSVKGEFYERELVSDAEHISRWRDAFDNLVVRHFLDPKAVHGRLFASRSPRGEA
jgi:hypothetical protein